MVLLGVLLDIHWGTDWQFIMRFHRVTISSGFIYEGYTIKVAFSRMGDSRYFRHHIDHTDNSNKQCWVHAEKCNAMQCVIGCRGGDAIQHFWVQLRDRGRLWRSTIGIESGFVYTWSVGQDFFKEMQQLVETCPGNTFSHQNERRGLCRSRS